MDADLRMLVDKGKIKSSNPENMSSEDVLGYVSYLKSKGMRESGISHNLGPLNNLLAYAGNSAVPVFKMKYRSIVPKRRTVRYPALDEKSFVRILDCSRKVENNDWERLKAYSLVILSICTGLRNKEIRLSQVDEIDVVEWIISVKHVKGEGTYGQPRTIAIRPEARDILKRYLSLRNKLVAEKCPGNLALFPALRANETGHLSSNSLQKLKGLVEKETGIKFDLRACRRTFGQLSIDQGLNLDAVSVLMGHNTTRTTENHYARKGQETAIREAQERWKPVQNDPGAKNPKIEFKNEVTGYA